MSTTLSVKRNDRADRQLLCDIAVCVASVAVYALLVPLLGAAANYLYGWGNETDWLTNVTVAYFLVGEPVLMYCALWRLHRPVQKFKPGLVVQSIILTVILTVVAWFAVDSLVGSGPSLEADGVSDHIEYGHVGPQLSTWARGVVAAHAIDRLKPGDTPGGRYDYYKMTGDDSVPMSPAIRALLPKDPFIHARLVLCHTAPPTVVVVQVGDLILIELDTSPSAKPFGGLRPCKGVTVANMRDD